MGTPLDGDASHRRAPAAADAPGNTLAPSLASSASSPGVGSLPSGPQNASLAPARGADVTVPSRWGSRTEGDDMTSPGYTSLPNRRVGAANRRRAKPRADPAELRVDDPAGMATFCDLDLSAVGRRPRQSSQRPTGVGEVD